MPGVSVTKREEILGQGQGRDCDRHLPGPKSAPSAVGVRPWAAARCDRLGRPRADGR